MTLSPGAKLGLYEILSPLYRSEFSRGDYYTECESEGIVASRWHGRGAEQLGSPAV